MKIKSLYISEYKTIKEQTFVFSDSLIALFVGQNGVGKSNLFEVISIIFEHLERSKSHPEFYSTIPAFDFELEYSCKGKEVKLVCRNGGYEIHTKNHSDSDFSNIMFNTFKPVRSQYIPDMIIAYYSGENKRVKTIYENHKKRWEHNLKRNSPSIETPILGRMFFTDQNLGELIFFTLWVFKDSVRYGKLIHQLFDSFIGIELDTKVEITFQNPTFSKKYPDQNIHSLIDNIYTEEENLLWGLTGKVSSLIRTLVENSLSVPIAYEDNGKSIFRNVNEYVTFNTIDFNSLSYTIYDSFSSPAELLDVLVACNHLNIIYEINSKISKNGQTINHSFMELSEGEQQLLTVIGLMLITSEFETLFLFDEPDTHLNPLWQRDFAKLLQDFDLNESSSHVLIATHSPLIVQSAKETDLYLFKRDDDNNIIIDSENHQIHNWRIDQVLVSEYFDLPSARPKSLDEFMTKREEILSKEVVSSTDIRELQEIEAEEGVLPTGETITDIQTMHLLRIALNKLK